MGGLNRMIEKKRSTAEKHISASVLQQYFSGSLKDAAKSLGVCPTTLKRICRQNGIPRWPSRKINKVNRSLKKIQSVLDSVEGVEGGLKFDTCQSFFFTNDNHLAKQKSNSTIHGVTLASSTSCTGYEANDVKMEEEYLFNVLNFSEGEYKPKAHVIETCDEESKLAALDIGPSWLASLNTIPWTTSDSHFLSRCEMDGDDGVVENSRPTSSGRTDSSNGSGFQTGHESGLGPSKIEASSGDSGTTKITLKATYREDTIRFKFELSARCFELYEEVAKRFKLHRGKFQLKYLDDEEEWVRLVNDSDLQECVEILESVGTRTLKCMVHDVHEVINVY